MNDEIFVRIIVGRNDQTVRVPAPTEDESQYPDHGQTPAGPAKSVSITNRQFEQEAEELRATTISPLLHFIPNSASDRRFAEFRIERSKLLIRPR